MSIPLRDVRMLRGIVSGLKRDKLNFYKPHENRAAMAIILRFNGDDGVKVARCFSSADKGITPEEVVERLELHSDPVAESSLSVLYLKKRFMNESRWSGVVSFPGGKRDRREEKTDFATAKYWCKSQLGMPIDTTDFVVLGRLPDYMMYSRSMREGLMTARFVLLHVGELTPSVRLAHYDIKALTWAPVTALVPSNVVRNVEKHNLFAYLVNEQYREFVAEYFPGAKLYFPSIPMPDHFGQLWGFTLTTTSSLLALSGQRRMDWPLFHSNSLIAQMLFVDAVHGFLEVRKDEVVDGTRLSHRLSFALVALTCLTFVLTVLSFVAVIIQAFILSFDREALLKKRRELHEDRATADAWYASKDLVVDKEKQMRERREQSRAASSQRWVVETEGRVASSPEVSGTFISFGKSTDSGNASSPIQPAA